MRVAMIFLFLCGVTDASTLCPHVVIDNSKITFDDLQKRFVGGDAPNQGIRGKTWKNIPASQAKFHLTAILQSQGYHHPEIKDQNGILYVTSGPPTYVSQI